MIAKIYRAHTGSYKKQRMRTNYVYLVQNLHTNQWQLLVEFSLYVDQNGTGTVMQVEYPAMTVLPFVVAKMEKLNRNNEFDALVYPKENNLLTNLSDLAGGAVQLTIFRIKVKNSTENILRACRNLIFCVLKYTIKLESVIHF